LLLRSISFRLSVAVGLALSAGLLLLLYFADRHHEDAVLFLKKEEASLLSDAIKGSLTHAMRQGREGRDAIHRAIEDVAARDEISRVRIFDAVGTIRYSSDPAEKGRKVDKDSENCRQCHLGEEIRRPDSPERARFFYTPEGSEGARHRLMGVVNPIYNEPGKDCTACHEEEQTVLGVLDVVVTLETVDQEIAKNRRAMAASGVLGVIAIVGVVALLIRLLIHRPVAALVEGTRTVGRLNLTHRIPEERRDELGNLARAFNEMTERLQRAQEEIRAFAENLEQKVEEKTAELRSTQVQMVRTEKMAAIGQMAAGVAHEINNPLTGVITFGHLLRRKIPERSQERADLDTILEEAKRCSRIARGLLDFARTTDLDRRDTDLREIVERTLSLVEHQPLFHNIEITRDYAADLPLVPADQGRMEQVFLNLVMNAAEAMEGRGRITITAAPRRTEGGGEEVLVSVADTGPGIPEEIQSRIFDPFFTTKAAGKGTGLGLSVSYRIVEDHGGRIQVLSKPGEGTTFSVGLPAVGRT
jgi:two-component system NtrC family sensor kinase